MPNGNSDSATPQHRVMSDVDVDEAWLSETLGRPGGLASMERRSIGTGQVGENVRYRLHWREGVDGPDSVVGKFPSLDAQSRETGGATKAYVREVGFYRDAKHTVAINTPIIHHLDEDIEANAFVLIMSDLAPAVVGDQIAGCSVDHAERAIDQAIALHAPHWGGDFGDRHPWAAGRDESAIEQHHGLLTMLTPMFVDCYRDRLAPLTIQMAEWVKTNAEAYLRSQRTPSTLVHGDYRLDNMLFADTHAAGEGQTNSPGLTVVDWQTASMGRGPADAAYFVGAGLLEEDRREAEPELMARYSDGIVDAVRTSTGATAEPDGIEFDYRVGAAAGLVMAIIASQIVGRTERGDEMFCVMADRHSVQMHDLGTTDLL